MLRPYNRIGPYILAKTPLKAAHAPLRMASMSHGLLVSGDDIRCVRSKKVATF